MTATSSPVALELHSGDLRLALRPDLGGCIAGFWLGDLAVLRSSEAADLKASRPSGCYPLVPYSNRLGFRRFHWAGQDHTTQPNFDDNPHSVHGVGWLRAWEVVSSSADQAVIRYVHAPDAHWPFAFEVTQTFVLTPAALELRFAFKNTAGQSQPVGLGWHPYFPKREHSRLHIEVAQRWDADPATQLPTQAVPQPVIDAEVRQLAFDNCFQGWTGAAHIRDEKLSLKLTSSMGYLVVFTPQAKDYYCVEPVSHVSDAIHMADPLAHGLVALAAGDTLEASMTLSVERA
ncbi:aldose 1-epimerase [Aquincola sp. MAHUQ-54]|uniref:Aldose 1-epimerase n=1 Tax=Aquincola agrisoli TaxID=3119538 RepID=A0AAW9Q5J9_9BURK